MTETLGVPYQPAQVHRRGPSRSEHLRSIGLCGPPGVRTLSSQAGFDYPDILRREPGAWTLLVAAAIVTTAVLPDWLGLIGIPIGVGLLVGTLEFVGPNEERGWPVAGRIVPIAYIAWSIWLIALGFELLA